MGPPPSYSCAVLLPAATPHSVGCKRWAQCSQATSDSAGTAAIAVAGTRVSQECSLLCQYETTSLHVYFMITHVWRMPDELRAKALANGSSKATTAKSVNVSVLWTILVSDVAWQLTLCYRHWLPVCNTEARSGVAHHDRVAFPGSGET